MYDIARDKERIPHSQAQIKPPSQMQKGQVSPMGQIEHKQSMGATHTFDKS